ncbi:MAG: squalene/phytoene synthase family protein, partial [Paracoccaceae bacterium]|nr:squalene/phytoene synthase family protein [Paracoccaceae bacterium]
MSLQACADLLERGDPDRFAAILAAPPSARGALLAIHATNLEIARAPWASSEPMLAEMRLQWWQDALAALPGN